MRDSGAVSFLNYLTEPHNYMNLLPMMFSQQCRDIYINGMATSKPDVETRIVDEVASYGKQMGWLLDAMVIIAKKLEKTPNVKLTQEEHDAFKRLYFLHEDIEKVKNERT
jgi:hypothetical protein